MIIADFSCHMCDTVTEHFVDRETKFIDCPKCGFPSQRIISFGKVYTGNIDAPWIKSVTDVVDKSNPAKHVQEFVKNPNRRTYHAWMKGEGIRPLDHSEKGGPPQHRTPPDPDLSRLREDVARRHFERKRIEI